MTAADDRYAAYIEQIRHGFPTFDWFGFDETVGERMSEAHDHTITSCESDGCLCWAQGVESVERQLVEAHDAITDTARTVEGLMEMAAEVRRSGRPT